ncbi:class I SAM-dependent methyltransferase [Nitrosomonas sp. Nm33]|uniref:class I SAM-dependent methyltransferase n=1 Tax=Nitrosomonas sp. Nm33 TaxID=133724 RepID=UPI000895F61D|nr:class I SAM-dependent methyltransferase [Nitrosomonas sp. Nm33]SDY65227.1 Methyltransferase domain-containing protein [Nitrosomonas sp. Nm33]
MAGYVDEVVIPYDRDLGPVLFDHYGADTARRIAEQSPHDVLEIAAGTGIVTRHLRNLLTKDAHLTAIDISDSMMDLARTKFLPDERITFRNADATSLPFGDEVFDAVVCQFGIMFFDQETAFREAYRVLRRRGRYLFRVWDSEQYNPFASLSFEVLKQFFPSDTPRFLFDPVSCHQIDPIKEKLIHIGFDPIVISVQRHKYDIFDVSAFARALVYSPVIFEIRDRGGVDPEEIVEVLAEAFKKEYGSNPMRYPMQAILFETEKS